MEDKVNEKSVASPCFRTGHLHSSGETHRSIPAYADLPSENVRWQAGASAGTLFAFIPVLLDGAFCEGG